MHELAVFRRRRKHHCLAGKTGTCCHVTTADVIQCVRKKVNNGRPTGVLQQTISDFYWILHQQWNIQLQTHLQLSVKSVNVCNAVEPCQLCTQLTSVVFSLTRS